MNAIKTRDCIFVYGFGGVFISHRALFLAQNLMRLERKWVPTWQYPSKPPPKAPKRANHDHDAHGAA
jgi:hypothetical protein